MTRVQNLWDRTPRQRRAAFLLLFSLAFAALGYSYSFADSSPSRLSALRWLTEVVPVHWLGIPWFVAAVIAAVSAFRTMPADRFGFVALFIVPAVWGALYAISWATGDAPAGLVTTVLYEALATAPLVVAGMLNPNPQPKARS